MSGDAKRRIVAEAAHARPYAADPAEVDGPGPEWYRELSEVDGPPWPDLPVMASLAVMVLAAVFDAAGEAPCLKCGGPLVCPDLASTLPYRRCGYGSVPGVGWVHE